jgi:hypothetical protein
LEQGVAHAEGILLLQTADVLRRPGTVLQIFEALRLGKTLTTVHVTGGGYDYAAAPALLAGYASRTASPWLLDEDAAVMAELLAERDATLDDMQRALGDAIPNLISIDFDPSAHQMQKEATVADIVRRATPRSRTDSEPPVAGGGSQLAQIVHQIARERRDSASATSKDTSNERSASAARSPAELV